MKIHGQRPRPRVAILGEFSDADERAISDLFPTVWLAKTTPILQELVNPREIDLLIVGEGISTVASNFAENAHVISFCSTPIWMPGPVAGTSTTFAGLAETEEYSLPDQPLPFHRVREHDFQGLTSTRGWLKLKLHIVNQNFTLEYRESVRKIFKSGAIAISTDNSAPLAVHFLRLESNKGLAWLPHSTFKKAEWIKALIGWWAPADPDSFPSIGNWARLPKWLTQSELRLRTAAHSLAEEREKVLRQFEEKIALTEDQLRMESERADNGIRQLLTEQGDNLVDEVATTFRELGFTVENIDESLEGGAQKREDLRLTAPETNSEWEALVEVRGYRRSAGTTADLARLYRFASFYRIEKGREPDLLIYVVNPQIELAPDQREAPLRSAVDDIKVFSDAKGLIVSTLDLFKARQRLNAENIQTLHDSIVHSSGRWLID